MDSCETDTNCPSAKTMPISRNPQSVTATLPRL